MAREDEPSGADPARRRAPGVDEPGRRRARCGFVAILGRAQRRQIDPGQPPRRRQGQHRLAEGADDAVARAGHRHRRLRARSCWSTRPACFSRAAASTGRWSTRPGRARAAPTRWCSSSIARAASDEGAERAIEWLRQRAPPGHPRAQQDRRGGKAALAGAGPGTRRNRRVQPHLHALGADRRRRRRSRRKRWRASVPPGPWLYPEDEVSDMPARLLAAEITREKLFWQLQQELPYSVAVETESWTPAKDGSARIEQVIYVEREGQRGIVIGKGGQQLKRIGETGAQGDAGRLRLPRPPLPVRQGAREVEGRPGVPPPARAGVGEIGPQPGRPSQS